MELLESINDDNLKERVRLALPSANSLRSEDHAAKKLPSASKKLEAVDFKIIKREGLNIDEYLIGADKDYGIYLFETLQKNWQICYSKVQM